VFDADDGSVVGRTGVRKIAKPCEYPRFNSDGVEISSSQTNDNQIQPGALCPVPHAPCYGGGGNSPSWVIWNALQGAPVQALSERMIVPSSPSVAAGQVIYLFPGVQKGTQTGINILQPVLGWNANNDNQWTMTPWNCCYNGTTTHGQSVVVNTGDAIWGSMTGENCNISTGVCPTWTVTAYDSNTRQTTSLISTTSYGQYMDGLFGSVLETYYVTACNQFPASPAYFGGAPSPRGGTPPFSVQFVGSSSINTAPPSPWPTYINNHSTAPNCGYQSTQFDSSGVYITF